MNQLAGPLVNYGRTNNKLHNRGKIMENQLMLFDPRFLESYAGHLILRDTNVALVELIANAWDAGATQVEIDWPDQDSNNPFRIEDNGSGMSETEFKLRWRTLAYDRVKVQGQYADFPEGVDLPKRLAFGRNGIGRFAAFRFGKEYFVRTWKNGIEVQFKVKRGQTIPIDIERIHDREKDGHGTEIIVNNPTKLNFPEVAVRAEIGMRFLYDPNFIVMIDGKRVKFSDIPTKNVEEIYIEIEGLPKVTIFVIDIQETDRTTRQHGIAWHVNNRLVGQCSWRGASYQAFIDGRRIEARRYTFIVQADCLADCVLQDWSGFELKDKTYIKVNERVQEAIHNHLIKLTKNRRKDTYQNIKNANKEKIAGMSPYSMEKWNTFVNEAQEACPSISESDLIQLAGVLANLEVSRSRYGLIQKLHELDSNQLDDLYKILDDWNLDMAKIVLDELQIRLQLIEELRLKTDSRSTAEVQELQPLFYRGLWIFGPEFETIEFTSNEGMTKVIQKLFTKESRGTRNRPDFAILPDSTVGLYSYPKYDEHGGESGVDRLVIVELKKPGITISTSQKDQCWKYVKELYDKGMLVDFSNVTCFVLGSQLDPNESHVRTEKNEKVKITPMLYMIALERAKSRVLKLYDKVKDAPFLDRQKINEFLKTSRESTLFSEKPLRLPETTD